MTSAYPKISIVTPSFNDAKYLETTIRSVIDQGYPNLEYVIIDGGSTDGSVDIIKKYEGKIAYWISGKDEGMYHALQKGLQRTTGEVMGWINSDDILHPQSLFTLGQIFGDFPSVQWVQGFPNTVDENGRMVLATSVYEVDKLFFYQRKHARSYKYIQQESTYWRRSLWDQAGGYVSTTYKYAGDFELWMRFFKHAKLHNIYALLGSFRLSREGQASIDHYNDYVAETFRILESYPLSKQEMRQMKYRRFFETVERWLAGLKRRTKKKLDLNHESILNKKIIFDYKSQKFTM